MAYKNPFDHSSRGKKKEEPGKAVVNPFDREAARKTNKNFKLMAKAAPRSSFGVAVKAPAKTGLDKMREIAEKRKAGLLKVKPGPKMTPVIEMAPKAAIATANGTAAGTGPGAKPSANMISNQRGSVGGSVQIKANPNPRPIPESQNPENNNTAAASGTAVATTAPAAAEMNSENYMRLYKAQAAGHEGVAAEAMTSENYMKIYKAQQGHEGAAAEDVTAQNYVEVYKAQEEQRQVKERQVEQTVTEQKIITEIRQQEQKNASMAIEARNLIGRIAQLRGQLGQGPDTDAGTYAAISQLEIELAQIPISV